MFFNFQNYYQNLQKNAFGASASLSAGSSSQSSGSSSFPSKPSNDVHSHTYSHDEYEEPQHVNIIEFNIKNLSLLNKSIVSLACKVCLIAMLYEYTRKLLFPTAIMTNFLNICSSHDDVLNCVASPAQQM